jgi:hypothetical protein
MPPRIIILLTPFILTYNGRIIGFDGLYERLEFLHLDSSFQI